MHCLSYLIYVISANKFILYYIILYSSHVSQFGSTPPLFDISYQFHFKLRNLSLPPIISSLVCFTHWRHFSGSCGLASGLLSHIHFRCIILNHFIHLLYGLLKYTVSGNKPPPSTYMMVAVAGTLNHLKNHLKWGNYYDHHYYYYLLNGIELCRRQDLRN